MTPADRATLRAASAHVVVGDVDRLDLDEAAAHHLFRVLRVRDGATVTATDGAGRWVVCRAAGGHLEPDGETRHDEPSEMSGAATIGVAIAKGERPEWIVQKLTELGVARIVLLHAERSVVRWDDARAGKHVARLGRVAVEALQQSRGVHLPVIDGPVAASEFLPGAVAAEPGGRPIEAADRTVAVGPEGGWSPDELALARGRVELGPTVLRVETAAVIAAARVLLR